LPALAARSLGTPLALATPRPCSLLRLVRAQDGRDQPWKAPLDLRAARRVLHFDAVAFAADQAGLPEHLEVLRQRRFGDRLLADVQETRAAPRTARADDLGIDGHPHWIRDRKSTRLNSSHVAISYAVFCLK